MLGDHDYLTSDRIGCHDVDWEYHTVSLAIVWAGKPNQLHGESVDAVLWNRQIRVRLLDSLLWQIVMFCLHPHEKLRHSWSLQQAYQKRLHRLYSSCLWAVLLHRADEVLSRPDVCHSDADNLLDLLRAVAFDGCFSGCGREVGRPLTRHSRRLRSRNSPHRKRLYYVQKHETRWS